MKILHIIIGLNVGGAENALKRLIESHLTTPNYQHSVISLTTIGKIGTQLQELGIKIYTLEITSFWNAPLKFLNLIKIIKNNQPDIVHSWMYHADLLGGIAAYLTKHKIIWSIRNTHATVGSGTASFTKYIMLTCAWLSKYIPKKIVCVANSAISSHNKYDHSKMLVIPNGYDTEKIIKQSNNISRETFRSSLGIDSNAIVIGSVGRFNDYKDFPTFIETASLLLTAYDNLKFLLIGRNVDTNNNALMILINKTIDPSAFLLLGERNDIPVCLKAMDIFCLHSISEGFPNVLGEAMCIGVPCITTDAGDAALMVRNAKLVSPISDPTALAEKVKSIITLSPEERHEIGAELQRIIKTDYSLQNMQQSYEKLYTEVANS